MVGGAARAVRTATADRGEAEQAGRRGGRARWMDGRRTGSAWWRSPRRWARGLRRRPMWPWPGCFRRAVLVVDGGAPQTVRVGGARARASCSRRRAPRRPRWSTTAGFRGASGEQVASSAGTAASEISLQADGGGHFFTSARINGVAVNALVTPGPPWSPWAAARRSASVSTTAPHDGPSATANGLATIWKVRLDAVELDGVRLLGVDAAVHETDLPVVLLSA